MQESKVIGVKEKCLEEERKLFYRETCEKSEFDFALNIYIEIATRWIEEWSISVEH